MTEHTERSSTRRQAPARHAQHGFIRLGHGIASALNRCVWLYLLAGLIVYHSVNHQKVIFKTLDAFRRAKKDVVQQALGRDVMKDFVLWDAIRYYHNIAALIPEVAWPQAMIGYGYYQAGEYAQALRHYQKAARRQEGHIGLAYNQGVIHFRLGQHPMAVQAFEQVLTTDPRKTLMYPGLISPFAPEAGQPYPFTQEARQRLLERTYAEAYRYLTRIYREQGKPTERLRAALEGLQVADRYRPLFYTHAIQAAYHLQKYKFVIQLCSQAIKDDPDQAIFYRYLALAADQAGIKSLARQARVQQKRLARQARAQGPQARATALDADVSTAIGEPIHEPDAGDALTDVPVWDHRLFLYMFDAQKYFFRRQKQTGQTPMPTRENHRTPGN